MTITLELEPELEACLRRKAEREGQDITTYLQAVVEREAEDDGKPTMNTDDKDEAWMLSHSALAKDWLRPEEDAAWQDL